MPTSKILPAIFIASLLGTNVYSQDLFQQKATSVGNIGVTFSNTSVIGNAFNANFQRGMPSLEYPLGSGIEHLFNGGLWVGAIVNGQYLVSTGASGGDSNGYGPGDAGYEFTADTLKSQFLEQSSLTDSPFFDPKAISHQDLTVTYTDGNLNIPGLQNIPIRNHLSPLGIRVTQQTYTWNYSFADFFVLINYTIKNESKDTLKNAYVGVWNDFVVRNVNITAPRGTDFFNKHGNGIIDSLSTAYAYDISGDVGFTDTYIGCTILGGYWRGNFIKKSNLLNGSAKTQVNYNFWGFNSAAQQGEPPANDFDRYLKMAGSQDSATIEDNYRTSAGNRSGLISIGPIPVINPGESITVVMSLTGAKMEKGDEVLLDTPSMKSSLIKNIQWARRTYAGEDLNFNGLLDAGEDTDNNGELTRYTLPTPPSSPKVRIDVTDGKARLFWDDSAENSTDPISKLKDFEGYRIYKTSRGDELDLTANLSSNLQKIAEFDRDSNTVFYNTGLQSRGNFINHKTNPVVFENDPVLYTYEYRLENLSNGWLYGLAVTAFDRGDSARAIESLESSQRAGTRQIMPGTDENPDFAAGSPFVYPNPFYVKALWDGTGDENHRLMFANLPPSAQITIFTLAGERVYSFTHEGQIDHANRTKWLDTYGVRREGKLITETNKGEHAWNLISSGNQNISSGLYLYTVKDIKTGSIKTGKFVIIN
ncbi:MAG: hypothetical protein J0L62_15090 [Bacteroidetes bacterium]|nr:hypothetical protein [Bacteroidota bacterium]